MVTFDSISIDIPWVKEKVFAIHFTWLVILLVEFELSKIE